MMSKKIYNDKWIGYLFIPFAGIFAYYIGDAIPFYESAFKIIDFIYIISNIVTGLIIWQIIKKIMFNILKEEITLLRFLKAFLLNLFVSLSFLVITRILHDVYIVKTQISVKFYTLELPTDALLIFIINLIYLILFYKNQVDQNQNIKILKIESPQKILIQSNKQSYLLLPSDIALVELENKVTYLYTYSGEKIVTVHPLKQIFQKLPETIFFLANRQFVIHKEVIRSYQLTNTRKLKIQLVPSLDLEKEIFVSKAKSHDFKSWFLAK